MVTALSLWSKPVEKQALQPQGTQIEIYPSANLDGRTLDLRSKSGSSLLSITVPRSPTREMETES